MPNHLTAHDWYLWLQKQERSSFDEYRGRPNRLISDFNGESQFTRDYEGREILELLQNANDAAFKTSKRGRMRLELLPTGLIAANTGEPFSSAGVSSLCLPHTSPKPAEGPQMIGNKGLGFRAVLNWTRFPLVLSGELALVFSLRVAKAKQAELEQLSEELCACIERQKHVSGDLVVPLLAFPGFTRDGNIDHFLDDIQKAVYSRCRELREAGYDTVIGMPFNRETIYTAARKQLEHIRPEVLLFARGLGDLEVVVAGEPPICWRRGKPGGVTSRVYLGGIEADYREWNVYSKRGTIPREYLPPEQPSSSEYEFVVAIPTNHKAVADYLYSYFPTEVRFPYPVVCHVTLDLQSNRQQPQHTPANQFVLGELAEFMAETAEKLAREFSPEDGLTLIAGDPVTRDGLEKFDFRAHLLNAAKTRALVPTLSDGLVIPEKARTVAFADTSWLPKWVFGSVVNLTSDGPLRAVLKELEVPPLTTSDWLKAEPALVFETVEKRANFIAGIIRCQVTEAFALSGLLVDGNGNPVPKAYRVFLPPVSQTMHSLPDWFEIRFLHPYLRQALTEKLARNQEDLAEMLSPLNVTSYSLDNVISALVTQANKRVTVRPGEEENIRHELLHALWGLFPSTESREDRPRFPREVKVLVLTQAGSYEDIRKLYLSSEYGHRGCILEDLYGSFAPEKLLVPPAALGFKEADHRLTEFFIWLGVAELPRETVEECPAYEFREYVKANLSEPVVMGEYNFQNVEDVPVLTFGEVASVDGLETFLSQAPPGAVLAWLASDNRAVDWKSPAVSHGRVGFHPSRAQYTRFLNGPIPSYVRWRLQTTRWLPTRNKRLARPQECLAEAVPGIDDLLAPPARPTPEQALRYGIPTPHFRDAFDRAGVLPGFSQIDPEQLYDLLLSLPSRDPTGSVAKSVYHAVLTHFEGADVRDSAARERFIRDGEIFARSKAGDKYFPVKDVLHVDSEDIPAALRGRVNVAALPKRSGSQKTLALFGICTLDRSQIIRRISRHQPVCYAPIFNDEIQRMKPLFLALRRSHVQRESKEFRELKVIVCSSIEGDVEFQGQKESLSLGIWDWILDDQDHTAYVLSDPAESDSSNSALLADAVGQIFAAVFRIERGDDFARLLACQRKDQLKMLKRLAGDDDIPAMEELERRYFDTAEQAGDDEIRLPDNAFALLSQSTTDATQPVFPAEQAIDPGSTQNDNQSLQIDSVMHTPSGPPAKVECRVNRKVLAGPRSLTTNRRVTDGMFCEYKAMEFEEHDTPPRFPIRVGNVTGWDAPGVDVLSFASAEARARFLAGGRSEACVARFIEVKGRSTKGAKIDLRDNELKAARKYGDRYFLYRIFERDDGNYELAMVKNPLADETGVNPFYEINLEAATRTEEFNLVGGLSENSYHKQFEAK